MPIITENTFRTEAAARDTRRELINLGCEVSLIAFDPSRDVFAFDIIERTPEDLAAAAHARLRGYACATFGCTVHPVNAVSMVAADVRESYPDMSDAEAVEHVRNTLRLPEEPPVVGAFPLSEDGSALALAYREILERR